MLPVTSSATSYWLLAESLPPDTEWNALQAALEDRLQQGSETNPTLTIPERQLLEGLRLREGCLHIPFYAEAETHGPMWWMALKGSCGGRIAEYPVH